MRPRTVYLTALLIRLESTWRTRAASANAAPARRLSSAGSTKTCSSRPLAAACGRACSASSRTMPTGSNGALSTISRPASAVSVSSVAFSTPIRSLAAASAAADCSRDGCWRPPWPAAAASTWATPVRPLRISWLSVAISADFERASRSASSSEAARSRASCSRSAASWYWRRRLRFRIRHSIEASAKAPQAVWATADDCGRESSA